MQIEYVKTLATMDMAERSIPIIILEGEEEGPKVWLVAGCHGNEVTGIEVIHRVLNELEGGKLRRGTIYAMPLMNPMGNELIERMVPIDGDNLNRNYPGKEDGEPTERLAYLIYDRIVKSAPDLVIDLHATASRSIPFVILDRFTDEGAHPGTTGKLARVADVFGITVVYDFAMEEYKKRKLDRSLPGALLNKAHILAYTVELGPSNIVSTPFVEVGVHGIYNTLRHLEMIDAIEGGPWVHHSKLGASGALRRDPKVRTNHTGLIQFLVGPGEAVQAGQAVARVKNILGKVLETVDVKHGGHVITLAERAVAFPGTSIMTLAVRDEVE